MEEIIGLLLNSFLHTNNSLLKPDISIFYLPFLSNLFGSETRLSANNSIINLTV